MHFPDYAGGSLLNLMRTLGDGLGLPPRSEAYLPLRPEFGLSAESLAGKRFGFTTGWRMLVEEKDGSGIFGQLLLLALAAALAMPLLGHFPELTAALGPPSISLLVGAFVFGLCMQIADGCGSGTLYKAGLGIPMNAAILPLFALGSFLGSLHLGFWLDLGRAQPAGAGPAPARGPGLHPAFRARTLSTGVVSR